MAKWSERIRFSVDVHGFDEIYVCCEGQIDSGALTFVVGCSGVWSCWYVWGKHLIKNGEATVIDHITDVVAIFIWG